MAGLTLCLALLAVPLVLLRSGPDASAAAGPALAAVPIPHAVATRPARPPAPPPPTTTTTTAPTPAAVAAEPVRAVVPTTTTTTAPPTTTTTTTTTTTGAPAPAVVGSTRTSGQVTYYDHPAGRCASPWLPFGTVVWVTNPANGATVSCQVDDREADTARAIDLATMTFAEIAPLSQGVVDAELRW